MQETQTIESVKRVAPGPRAWPVVGNLGVFRGLLPFFEQQWAVHGDVFRIRTASMRATVAAHPDDLQRVLLGQRQNYVKGPVYDHLRTLVGDGLVTLEGEAWRARRTLAQPAFHRQSLERLAQIMIDRGARYFDDLSARIGTTSKTLDIHREMVAVTMDVVVNALFGPGTLASGAISYHTMSEALEVLSNGVNGVPLPSWLPTPHNFKFRRTLRELNQNVYDIIRVGRERGADSGTLLSMLLDARDEQGQPLSDQAVRSEVLTLFLAGHETTALTLTWLFALLSEEREVLRRMVEEVDGVLGGRDPGFADVPKLQYVRQVIDETLRLRPPAAIVGRNAVAADELGGYRVEAGEVVLPFIWAAHRHRDHLGTTRALRSRALRAGSQQGAAPGELSAVLHRPPHLHRQHILAHRDHHPGGSDAAPLRVQPAALS
ncbi:MAG: cytochrome P450 [Myxococcales bacterium]